MRSAQLLKFALRITQRFFFFEKMLAHAVQLLRHRQNGFRMIRQLRFKMFFLDQQIQQRSF